MLDKAVIDLLKELVSAGRLEDAFVKLKENLRPVPNHFIALEGRFQNAKHDIENGLVESKDFVLESNKCNASFLSFIKAYEKEEPTENIKFSPHHQFTCDRSDQYYHFTTLLENTFRPRQHFFYIFGGEAQAHRGIFQRFVNRIKGIDLDYINANHKSGYEVAHFSVPIPFIEDLDRLGTEFSRMILAGMKIADKDMEQIAEKSLAFGLQKSPLLSEIRKDGKILFHFSINEALWNAQKVPQLASNFIEFFCLKNLPADSPELFFFFSMEYDDNNLAIRQEIEKAMHEANYLKNYGELKMVNEGHINNWFDTYKFLWETVSERKRAKIKYFGEKTPDMYMEEVQIQLTKVINEINNGEKYGKRN